MQSASDPAFSRLRILEIGDYHDLKGSFPGQTDLLWTGERTAPAGARECSASNLLRAWRDLRGGKYDVVVVRPPHHAPWHPRRWLRSLLHSPTQPLTALFRVFGVTLTRCFPRSTPMIAIDKADSFGINRHNFFLLDRVRFYFKRELPADKWQAFYKSAHPDLPGLRIRRSKRWHSRLDRLRPIAIGVPKVETAGLVAEKATDIFYAGQTGDNSSIRSQGIGELRALAEKGYKVDIASGRLGHDEYLRRMSQAWLAWSPAGLGWECYRHYEALQCRTVPVINYPTILRHQALRDGEHVHFYAPEPGGLAHTMEKALADKQKLAEMAEAGRNFVCTHHLHEAIYRAVLETAVTGGDDRLQATAEV